MKVGARVVYDYYQKELGKGNQPTLRKAAVALGVSHATVREYVLVLCARGEMVRRGHKLYLVKDGVVLDQRKAHNEETNLKKQRAGKAGAERLRARAKGLGVMPSALSRMPANDDREIEARIEKIVEKAKKNGTYCHPRPKYVVLIGQKAG